MPGRRPMNHDGTHPHGDCLNFPEGQPVLMGNGITDDTGKVAATGRVRYFEPEAAFYLFCAVDGFDDSRALAYRLVDEAGVGAAPSAGIA